MDYDSLAASYAAHREADSGVVEALRREARVARSSRVLEVGCGTGNYVVAFQEATGCAAWGVDPSAEMLRVARSRSTPVEFARAPAEALPFPAAHFDFLFSVDVVHHLADTGVALTEAFRVLRPGGTVCVVMEDEEAIRGRLHSRYFPDTVAVELDRYPPVADLRTALRAAGFEGVRTRRTATPHTVTDSRPYRDRAFSSLHLIPDEAHRAGVARLERDLAAGPLEAVARHVVLWGARPSPS